MSVEGKMPPTLSPGARLRIELANDSTPIELGCELVWAEASGKSGMRFLIMSETSKHELKKLLSRAPGSNLPMSTPLTGLARIMAQPKANPIAPRNANLSQEENPTAAGVRTREGELQRVVPVSNAGLSGRAAGDPALTFLTERACKLGQADGAAIALLEGAGFFCRAITGMAPPCGTQIQANSALSAECLRTGQLVRCDDVAMDPRVDPGLYRQLNLRSVIVVPIHSGDEIIGLLEMFSMQAHAFDTLDLLSLRLIAESAGAVVTSDSRPAMPALSPLSFSGTQVADAEPQPAPKARAIIPGILVCDVCGCENSMERDHVCRQCDVPLPTAAGVLPPSFTAEAEVTTEGNPATSDEERVSDIEARKNLSSYVKTYLAALLLGMLLFSALRHRRAQHWSTAFSSAVFSNVQASEPPPYPAGAHAMQVMDATLNSNSSVAAGRVITRAGDEDEKLNAKTTPRVNLARPGEHLASPGVHDSSPGVHVASQSHRSRSSSSVPQRDFVASGGIQVHPRAMASAPAAAVLGAQIPAHRAAGILVLAPPELATPPAKTKQGLWKRVTGIFSRNPHHPHRAEAQNGH